MENKEYIDFTLNQTIGNIIRKEREKQNLTLDQLAKKSGVSKQHIYYLTVSLSLGAIPMVSLLSILLG